MNDKIQEIIKNAPSLEKLRQMQGAKPFERKKHVQTEEEKKELINYWDKVQNSKPTTFFTKKVNPEPFPYEIARKWLFQIATSTAKTGKLVLTPQEAKIWQMALKWFTFQKDSPIDITKDLFLFGNTGRGKTFLSKCLVQLGEKIKQEVEFKDQYLYDWSFTELNTVAEECQDKKNFAPIAAKVIGNWVFDELGNEPLVLKVWGNEHRFFERVFTKREAGASFKRAIYTSNLNPNELKSYYQSKRLESRMKGRIGAELPFTGTDKRLLLTD